MKRVVSVTIIILCLLIVLGVTFFSSSGIVSASSNATMRVEVDLVGFTPPEPFIGIEVPDYVYLGNLSKKTMKTDDVRVDINNTGNINITITPFLKDSGEKIFSYLFFQRRTNVAWQKIGNWSLKIEKPEEDETFRDEYFYMQLDLKKYDEPINEDIIGHEANITFLAMPD
ncbi:MAG: hypothetical protein AABY32_03715 [Nanoarchaeota archaeon]